MGRCIQSDTVSLTPSRSKTPGLSHNGLLLYVGSPGVSLPVGPVHGLLLWRPRWRILRLRLGRRIRSGIRRLRWYVGNALRRLRTPLEEWGTATDSDSEWALPQLSESACPSWVVLAKSTKSSSHPSTGLTRTSSCSGLTAAHDI